MRGEDAAVPRLCLRYSAARRGPMTSTIRPRDALRRAQVGGSIEVAESRVP
ncbi:MAG: hypothetical protein AVDCRST_MAG93-6546 [uncultured Chloroflexia bacterium]|uniref:Uncharacterized protein n=1 Tax=uncultured Chloroflexia bacterium TaxID=1672391 RepID=A0A6J4LRU6_9CHLR|nr:MAG: hypothetical protein AVDCRST_MAG93-6546 [uncultured Chloroflexia bacterium]